MIDSKEATGISGPSGKYSDPYRTYDDLFEGEEASYDDAAKIDILFHRLWTKARDTEDYNKREWKGLAQFLTRNGIFV